MNERVADVIVIGAGAAGLSAAAKISAGGVRTVVLEARARLGGRIWTERAVGWPRPIELGAEFIHGGNRPLWSLMRSARVRRETVINQHWLVEHGVRQNLPDAWERIDAVMKQIGPRFDGSFSEWLQQNGGAIEHRDRALATAFVQGFQGAPLNRMSAPTLFEATKKAEEQFRVVSGYDALATTLAKRLRRQSVEVRLQTVVTDVRWKRGAVSVVSQNNSWNAAAVLITVPLGVLRARAGETGAIRFDPGLIAKHRLWRSIESGHAIRLVLRLRGDAWRRGVIPLELRANSGRALGFLHSHEPDFPVWWAETPSPILVGWTGGPAAARMAGWTPARIFKTGRRTLARLLGCGDAALEKSIVDWRTHNWAADPFTRGAYSFSTAGHENAPDELARPVVNTLFFAGEATAEPLELGTVHGAIASGERAAREILKAI